MVVISFGDRAAGKGANCKGTIDVSKICSKSAGWEGEFKLSKSTGWGSTIKLENLQIERANSSCPNLQVGKGAGLFSRCVISNAPPLNVDISNSQ